MIRGRVSGVRIVGLAERERGHRDRTRGMNVRESGGIGTYESGMAQQSHIELHIGRGMALRVFDAEGE